MTALAMTLAESPPPEAFDARRAVLYARLKAVDEAEIRSVLYPRWVYHLTEPARIVPTAAARAALGAGWQNRPLGGDGPSLPAPVLTALVPDMVAIGQPSFTLHVHGTGFGPGAVIVFNGYDEPTTLVSPTEVTTGVNMDVWTAPSAPLPVFVRNADGEESAALTFTFTAA